MTDMIVFGLPGSEALRDALGAALSADIGLLTVRQFPDGETYVRGESRCDGRIAVLASNLYRPNSQVLPLLFCVEAIRALGAKRVILIAPYLPYMRQDKQFQAGEVVTSRLFATLLSDVVDGLVTIDPHLHRFSSLEDIYSIPSHVSHAAPAVARWIESNIVRPVIIGPDSESEQWVSEVAKLANSPFLVLSKTRLGDRDVRVEVPSLEPWRDHTPVLVDDIISTAHTMIETVGHLIGSGYSSPVCIGVHAVFAPNAFEDLVRAGTADVITGNSVPHHSNAIDLTPELVNGVRQLMDHIISQMGG